MFDFYGMTGTYETRKINNYTDDEIVVDTAAVNDFPQLPFETGLRHPSYNNGDWVIVEVYKDKESSRTGHNAWVELVKSDGLPTKIIDCRSLKAYQKRIGGKR